jgi:hypothetical protein
MAHNKVPPIYVASDLENLAPCWVSRVRRLSSLNIDFTLSTKHGQATAVITQFLWKYEV